MAGEINLTFFLGVVCIAVTFGQMVTTTKPVWIDCPGTHGNFTFSERKLDVTLNDICGHYFAIYLDIEKNGLLSLNYDINFNCMEMGIIHHQGQVTITSVLSVDELKSVIRNTLWDNLIHFPGALMANRTDYCTWTVKLFATYQNEMIEYASPKRSLVLTVGPGPFTELKIEEDDSMPEVMPYISLSSGFLKSTLLPYRHARVMHRELPVLADDASYTAVAFLRYNPSGFETTGAQCNELYDWTPDYQDYYPYYNSSDYIVGFTTFKASTDPSPQYLDLTDLLDENVPDGLCDETDINENADDPMIDAGEPKDDEGVSKTIKSENCCIYGYYDLVYMVDVYFSMFPPTYRCSYFKAYPVHIPCDTPQSMDPGPFTCNVVQNVFRLGEAFFTTKGSGMDEVTMQMPIFNHFERELHGSSIVWKESKTKVDSYHKVKVRGYPLIELLWRQFESSLTEYDCVPESLTEADVTSALKEFDGVDISIATFEESMNMDLTTAYYDWVDSPTSDIETELHNMEMAPAVLGTFDEMLTNAVKMATLTELLELKDAGTDTMREMGSYKHNIPIKDIVTSFFYDPYSISDTELLMKAKNITTMMVRIKHMYGTEYSCFGKIYDKIMELIRNYHYGYLQVITDVYTSQYLILFDYDYIHHFMQFNGLDVLSLWNASHIRLNGCIRQLDRLPSLKCDEKVAVADLEPEVKQKVCKVRRFREYIFNKINAFGLSVILRDWLSERAKEDFDDLIYPMTIQTGGYSFWDEVLEDEMQYFYEVSILPTYSEVCIRKMASCRCEMCYKDMPGADGGMYDTTSTTTYSPFVKKRR